MKKLVALSILSLFSIAVSFASELTVLSFTHSPTDITARTNSRASGTGEDCALIKLSLPVRNVKFGQNVEYYRFDVNEYWLYVAPGTEQISIYCPGFEPLDVRTVVDNVGVQSKNTYHIKIGGYNLSASNEEIDLGGNYAVLDISPKQIPNISVRVDDEIKNVDNSGIMKAFLPYGSHPYRIEAPGYQSETGHLQVNKNRETRMEIQLRSNTSGVSIISKTPGSKISINGDYKGVKSWNGPLAPGSYKIEVSHPSYVSYVASFKIAEACDTVIHIPALEPIYGTALIAVYPVGSAVTVDGKPMGQTPIKIDNLLIGSHGVSVSKDGYSVFTDNIVLSNSEPTYIKGSLHQLSENNAVVNTERQYIPDRVIVKDGYLQEVPGVWLIGDHGKIEVGSEFSDGTMMTRYGDDAYLTYNASGRINGHEYVDLGLPSGTLWATCNVGANRPSDCGEYYAWAEIKPYPQKGYKEGKSKYSRKKMSDITGNPLHDVAAADWSGGWRMPSRYDYKELIMNCKWEKILIGETLGYNITGPNGNSIFLPCGGYREEYHYPYGEEFLCYWTSSTYDFKEYASMLLESGLNPGGDSLPNRCRSLGCNVRPVLNPINHNADANIDHFENRDNCKIYDDTPLLTDSIGIINGHEYVDLGLPSGTLWATCNVGAKTPSDCGEYYAWAEIKPISPVFRGINGKELELRDITGNPVYDVAAADWGDEWRMPTEAECHELIKNCKWKKIRIESQLVFKITGPNGKFILLPVAGAY